MKREPDFLIGNDGKTYLKRWWIWPRNNYFNAYLHLFLGNDEDRAPHSHPWASISLILSGGYYELTFGPDKTLQRKWYGPGSIIFRGPSYTHRIELAKDKNGELLPCKTLFLTGPRTHMWYFFCEKGRVPWYEFVDNRDSGKVGKGCD